MIAKAIGFVLSSTFAFANWPGLSAKWVQRDHQHQVGVLEYLDQGADSVVEKRRSDALDKMIEFCPSKHYKILSESNSVEDFHGLPRRQGSTIAASIGGFALAIDGRRAENVPQGNYNYIKFKCTK